MLEGKEDIQSNSEMGKILDKCAVLSKQVHLYLNEVEGSYDSNKFNNLNSLAPIIGTICDQQIKADVAWAIPQYLNEWLISRELAFKAGTIACIKRQEIRTWLEEHMADKWPKKMSRKDRKNWLDNISGYIIRTCEKIRLQYQDEPDNMFAVNNGNLSIPLVYFLLRQFDGIGPKKASMVARDFGKNHDWRISVTRRLAVKGITIAVNYLQFTEMPIDVHVKRVFQRLGFQRYNQPQDFQNLAKLIYPENPGLVDDYIWQLGRNICRTQPKCSDCPLSKICEYKTGNK